MDLVFELLLVLGGAWLLLALFAWVFQRRLLYFPSRREVPVPGGPEWAGLRDVRLSASDGTPLRAWHWPGRRGATLLLFHGNAGDRGDRLGWAEGFHRRGWGVFLLDYRGYGGSGGSPTEVGIGRDAAAAREWLGQHGGGPLVYFGESLGCSVAVALAARSRPAAVVLQGGAPSLAEVGQRHYPWLPVRRFMWDRFDVREEASRVRCPVLSIHGALDTLVPLDLGRRLFDALPGPKTWFEIPFAGHNDVVAAGGEAYFDEVHGFLARALGTATSP